MEKVNTMLKLFHERWGSTFSGTTQEPDNLRCPQAPDLLANLFSIDSLHSHSYRIGWNGDICRRERQERLGRHIHNLPVGVRDAGRIVIFSLHHHHGVLSPPGFEDITV